MYAFYAQRQIRLLKDAQTSDKGWKERYFFIKREGLLNPVGTSDSGVRLAWTEENHSVLLGIGHPSKEATNQATSKPIPEGIPLSILKVPYTHVLKVVLEFLLPAELAEKERKKKEKKVTQKAGQTSKNKEPEPTGVTKIVDSLLTRTIKEINHEAEQCVFKPTQDCRYLSEVVIKTNNVWKKKTTTLNNLAAMNKKLKKEVQHLK
ncbi:hypothetical protein FNV43_RR21803 [Rhamnella rubrinervis]|uniref:Uncharacterized protein n=1 Tax=Rhamnella rubrinervis TaxID=2594499 RepID=A0A8K0DUY6_9ROSA|nr:hypothetical protein FNV43_RR21803 [Rhamnella rubrinervis]